MTNTKASRASSVSRSSLDAVAEECLAVRLRILTRAISNSFNRLLRPHGLTVSQLSILVAVARRDMPSQGEICRVLHLEKSSLSRDVSRLIERKWLKGVPGDDRREIRLAVTPTGLRLVGRALPAWRAAQNEAARLIGKDVPAVHRAVKTVRGRTASRVA